MKHKRWIALLLAAVFAVSAMSITAFAAESTENETETAAEKRAEKAGRGKHGHKEKVEEPENAVGKDAAKEAALSDAGLAANQVETVWSKVRMTEDGTVIYKVRFTFDGQRYSYQIDALTGEILDKKQTEAAEKDSVSGHSSHAKHGKRQRTESADDMKPSDGNEKGAE